MFLILSAFLSLFLSPSSSVPQLPCNENDKSNLLVIRDSWGSSSPTPSWTADTDCCRDWAGVSCDPATGRVTALVFPEDPAVGKIPTVLGDLEYLQVLYFHNMPNLYGAIPPELAKLARLRRLTISSTGVYGSIPPALGSLSRLYDVNLSGNKLSGDASFLFGRSKAVKKMDLSKNQLGFDLTKIEFPEELRLIDVSSNEIYGGIPSQITKVAKLRYLNVSYNQLCGRIPIGGPMERFGVFSYVHNKCLCGAPLAPCSN